MARQLLSHFWAHGLRKRDSMKQDLEVDFAQVISGLCLEELQQAQKNAEDVLEDYTTHGCVTRVRLNMVAYDQD